jgi:succinate dehydrogenase flavin-adding protein (antitoxin of CptAB toxin-antitoxin module)
MYSLEELERQNRDIANLCHILLVLVQEPKLRGNPYVCDLVSRFYDKVWMHLMFEDKSLYTDLLNSQDHSVVEQVTAFHESAKALKKRFGSHIKQWCHIDANEQEHIAFKSEMTDVIGAIMERVAAENEQMIPLVREQQHH